MIEDGAVINKSIQIDTSPLNYYAIPINSQGNKVNLSLLARVRKNREGVLIYGF